MVFDKYAAKYDAGFMGKASSRFYIDLIQEMDVKDDDNILDVGCGTGFILDYISKKNKIRGFGVDVSEPMIAAAKAKNTGCSFLVGDSGKLPFENASMNVMIACMAYHHFSDQKKFREEALRVLKPNGCLYICDPRFPAPVRWFFNTFFKDAGFHSTRRNAEEFIATGFAVEKIFTDAFVQVLRLNKKE